MGAKLDRIGADLEKARKKRAEWDARVKDLERRYREEENSEIHTVWEDAKNRIVDLHCFEYTGEGEILYEGDCFPIETFSGKGKIEEIEVSCIEPYSQVMFHLGYEFDENDVHDVKLLCETFHIEIPNEYR